MGRGVGLPSQEKELTPGAVESIFSDPLAASIFLHSRG